MEEIFLHEKDIPSRCDSCPFHITITNQENTSKLNWICSVRNTPYPMAILYYTDTMYWKDKECPIYPVERRDKEIAQAARNERIMKW